MHLTALFEVFMDSCIALNPINTSAGTFLLIDNNLERACESQYQVRLSIIVWEDITCYKTFSK